MKSVFEYCIDIRKMNHSDFMSNEDVLDMATEQFFDDWFSQNILADSYGTLKLTDIKERMPEMSYIKIYYALVRYCKANAISITQVKQNARKRIYSGIKIK